MVIGYYVHHVGAGHLTRASVIAQTVRARGHEVVLLGSDLRGLDGVTLPPDDIGEGLWSDPTAGGALHWLPMDNVPTRSRMRRLAGWVERRSPDAFVVDVSVEVTALMRLLGVPSVVVAQPGRRDDRPHRLAYRLAQAVLAPWPVEADGCVRGLEEQSAKVTHTGGISRLRPRPGTRGTLRGVVLAGRDDPTMRSAADALARRVPDLDWVMAGAGSWMPDIEAALATAAVVVSHAGQNAVADIAAVGAPAVVVPCPRPHGEQEYLATALSEMRLTPIVPADEVETVDWTHLVGSVIGTSPDWERWCTEGATERAADLIEETAGG
ncbi:MAG: glycosyltransferase [Dermatophilaceae bacterium]